MRMAKVDTRLPCSKETRDEILYPLKKPQESYDDLLRRISKGYIKNAPENEFLSEEYKEKVNELE